MDARRAVPPPTVKLAMHFALTLRATLRAARMIALALEPSVIFGLLLCRYSELIGRYSKSVSYAHDIPIMNSKASRESSR